MNYPAPVGGWNARDALAAMKPNDAIVLNNWYPRTSYVEIRGGYEDHATGMTGLGKTLVVYNKMTGVNEMFCSTVSNVYNVSSSGAVGASVASRTDGKHQWVNYGDGTNNWLIMCNGVDKPLYYDGTTWTAVDSGTSPALTGITTTNLISLFVFKGRLVFIPKDSLSFWYLAAGSSGGALTEFDLSGVAKKGGYLMAGASWTLDAGDGIDDRFVIITSEGEAIVYQGTDPSSANAWSLIGVYELGKPLGRKCLQKAGGDLVVLTENGAFPLSTALLSSSIDYKNALSNKIENAFTDVARSYRSNFGWCAYIYPAQSALIVNVPIAENGEHQQYVMNTITKSWCRFTEWDAEDFAVYNNELYFTTGTKVVKAWAGRIDGTDDIEAYGKTAFSYFNTPGKQKQFKLFRPVIATNGNISFLTDIDVDFNDEPITGVASYSVVTGATWDVDKWDESYWAAGLSVTKEWTSPSEYTGFSASGKLKIATNSLNVQWMSSDFVYETGGIIG